MKTLKVYCNYHNESGTCTEEDYNDAKNGTNPSRMVRVQFKDFSHAVPFHTIAIIDDTSIDLLKRLLTLRKKGQLFTHANMVDDGDGNFDDMSTLNEELLDILDKAEKVIKNYKEPEPSFNDIDNTGIGINRNS